MVQAAKFSPDTVEIELIRSLYDGLVPSLVMSTAFLLCGGLIVLQSPGDGPLATWFVLGVLVTLLRLWIAWRDSKRFSSVIFDLIKARRFESRFAGAYIGFAAVLGFFAASAMLHSAPTIHLLTLCLVMGYAAGVAAGAGLRPQIAIASLLLAVVPPLLALLSHDGTLYLATIGLTAAFLAGGIFSIYKRHARALEEIGMRQTFASLARRDSLTGLPNRLALWEWFDSQIHVPKIRPIAVHCLDLNGFKQVNDSYGHPIGDMLLARVARRLQTALRDDDIAARLGGDEFVVIQRQLGHRHKPDTLAKRIAASIGRPYVIGEHDIRISTSVGYILCDDAVRNLEQLIALADEALYKAKRSGEPVCAYEPQSNRAAA